MGSDAAVFVLPSALTGQLGPVAAWVSTTGWAQAASRVLGDAWIVTHHGVVDAREAGRRGSVPVPRNWPNGVLRRVTPTLVKTALKDVREWRRARTMRVDVSGPWQGRDVAFVWQRHEMFATAGIDLARALNVPSVLFVPSVLVWQARQWNVPRPGWSGWLERHGEVPALRSATLVAAGSDLVAEQVRRLGVSDERVLVTPTGVDLGLFSDASARAVTRKRLGIDDRFVIGWVGSFRAFHAAQQALDAVTDVEGATLLMVGDGPERPRLERLATERGIAAVFTGTVAHEDMPAHLAAMDAALVLASHDEVFHYSPLKLAEYFAAGLAVVAPRVAQLAERIDDGTEALLIPPGDRDALVAALVRLRDDGDERRGLGAAARAAAERSWSWDRQIERITGALEERRL